MERGKRTNMTRGIIRGRGKDVSTTNEEYGICSVSSLPLAPSSALANAQIFFAAPIFFKIFSSSSFNNKDSFVLVLRSQLILILIPNLIIYASRGLSHLYILCRLLILGISRFNTCRTSLELSMFVIELFSSPVGYVDSLNFSSMRLLGTIGKKKKKGKEKREIVGKKK